LPKYRKKYASGALNIYRKHYLNIILPSKIIYPVVIW